MYYLLDILNWIIIILLSLTTYISLAFVGLFIPINIKYYPQGTSSNLFFKLIPIIIGTIFLIFFNYNYQSTYLFLIVQIIILIFFLTFSIKILFRLLNEIAIIESKNKLPLWFWIALFISIIILSDMPIALITRGTELFYRWVSEFIIFIIKFIIFIILFIKKEKIIKNNKTNDKKHHRYIKPKIKKK